MNENQFEIADKLLKLMLARQYMFDKDQMYWAFIKDINGAVEQTKQWQVVSFVISILVEQGLVEWLEGNHRIRLKSDGMEAGKIGVAEFLKQREEKNKPITIHNSNVNFGVNTGEQNLHQTFHAPEKKRSILKEVLIGLFITIAGGLIIYFITQGK